MAKSKSNSRAGSKPRAKSSSRPTNRKKAPKNTPNQNLEIIITLALFFGFIIYGAGQCNKAKVAKDYQDTPTEQIAQEVQLAPKASIKTDISPASTTDKGQINLPKLAQKQPLPSTTIQTQNPIPNGSNVVANAMNIATDTLQKYNQLWVTIDQLKLRKEPNLKSTVLLELPLFERVYYLNQKTAFLQEINLGAELVNEPWLLIQHKNGTQGWAYGAGLNFHKEKRAGVR